MSSEGWKTYKLEEVAEIVGGGTPSTTNSDYWEGDIPWLTPRDLSTTEERFVAHGERNISRLGLENSSAKLLPTGTVLLTTRAPIGYLAIASNPMCTNQGFKSLIPNNQMVDSLFLYYLLKNNVEYLKSVGVGTTFAEISGGALRQIEFEFPEKSVQHQIAEILSGLDDKIELNRRTNKTLEEIAHAIFKEWFVDFNYPGATGELVDSPFGPIPKGWRVVSLTSELDIVYGKNLPTSKLIQQGYPVFGGNGLIGYFDRYIYEEPQVIVACRGAASGKINQSLPKSFVTNNSLVFFIPDSSIITFPFLKYFCLNTDFTSYVSGSAQPQLTIEALDYANLLVPDIKLIAAFTKLVSIFESKMRENDIESIILATIRDELLGNLLIGDIDV